MKGALGGNACFRHCEELSIITTYPQCDPEESCLFFGGDSEFDCGRSCRTSGRHETERRWGSPEDGHREYVSYTRRQELKTLSGRVEIQDNCRNWKRHERYDENITR